MEKKKNVAVRPELHGVIRLLAKIEAQKYLQQQVLISKRGNGNEKKRSNIRQVQ